MVDVKIGQAGPLARDIGRALSNTRDSVGTTSAFRANQGVDAVSVSLVVGGEVLNTIHDALTHPPPPKPSSWMLVVQIGSPALLGTKAVFDFISALRAFLKTPTDQNQIGFMVLNAFFLLASVAATSILVRAFIDAHKTVNKSHERAINWVKWRRRELSLDKEDGPPPPKT